LQARARWCNPMSSTSIHGAPSGQDRRGPRHILQERLLIIDLLLWDWRDRRCWTLPSNSTSSSNDNAQTFEMDKCCQDTNTCHQGFFLLVAPSCHCAPGAFWDEKCRSSLQVVVLKLPAFPAPWFEALPRQTGFALGNGR